VSKRIRILLFILLLAVMVTSWVVAQSDTEQPDGNLVIPSSIFVRGGPGDNFVAVGALYAGDEVTPLNRSVDGLWILIPYSRGYGWIQRYLIEWVDFAALDLLPVLEANVTPIPLIATREPVLLPTSTPEGNYVLVVNAESAYLRAGPGRTYLRLGQLAPGDLVEPLSRNEDGEWILVRYLDTRAIEIRFAWIARDLVSWVDEAALDALPIVDEDALTPTVTFTPSATSEPSATSTATAVPTDTPTATDTATATDTPSVTPSATATATPSITPSNTATSTDIPTATDTATATETPSVTPSDTATATDIPSITPSNTVMATDTATATETEIPSLTPSDTAIPTDTPTDFPTNTPTAEPTVVEVIIVATNTDAPTDTPVPTDTATATNTPTDEPTLTNTPSVTPSETATATETEIPSLTPSDTATATDTAIPTDTPTEAPTSTDTPSVTPSETATATATPTDVPTNTPEPLATATDVPTDIPIPSETATDVPTATPTDAATQVALVVLPTDAPTAEVTEQALVLPETPIPTQSIIVETVPPDTSGGFTVPIEALIGVVILLIVLGYIFLYWRGLVAADRYRDGFVIDECPVCKRGGLHVDEKPGRLLGIPQVRRTVRCDVCRSVLRETGAGRWRYAVDRIENAAIYDRFNGKEITDDELLRLAGNPPKSSARPTNPQFLDEDKPDTSGR
jgi:uncharacterized protein YgiM (DUF1202 family)